MARTPIHPGEILSDELRELGISAAEIARLIHVPANQESPILSGKRTITADTALRLGRWFGTGPPTVAQPAASVRSGLRPTTAW